MGRLPQWPAHTPAEVSQPCDFTCSHRTTFNPAREGAEEQNENDSSSNCLLFCSLCSLALLATQSSPPECSSFRHAHDASGQVFGGARVTAQLEGVSVTVSGGDFIRGRRIHPDVSHWPLITQFVRSPLCRATSFWTSPPSAAHHRCTASATRLAPDVVVTAQAEPALAQETTASVMYHTRMNIEARPIR